MDYFKKTKIVATISNDGCTPEFIKSLYDAGMNVVRLNTAHQTTVEALEVIKIVRQVADDIAILVDTKGPEIRTNSMNNSKMLRAGERVKFKGEKGKDSDDDFIRVNYNGFVKDVPVGSKILIDDGLLELVVVKKEADYLVAEAKNDGIIEQHKSINIPSAYIQLPSLSKKDIRFIEFAAEHNLDFIAHSFVRNAADVIAVQAILDSYESPIKIIAKIENSQGVEHIDEILDHAYGIMVARGDLAVEISPEKLPVVQKTLIHKALEKRSPVIVATQMLNSMISNPRPTRAEVNDVASAVFEGADAVMLSGETAYGKYPVESVQMMSRIIEEVEKSLPEYRPLPVVKLTTDVSAYLVKAAIEASAALPVKVIIADTWSGTTVRELSAYRGHKPVFAQCYQPHVGRQLVLSYGVYIHLIKPKEHHQEFIEEALNILLNEKQLTSDDSVLIVAGSLGFSTGTTFIEIGSVEKLLRYKEK